MTEEINLKVESNHPWLKWVGGITVMQSSQTREERAKNPEYDRYLFYDNDSTDIKFHFYVLHVYKKYGVDVVSQRIGQGYHYFGGLVKYQIYKQWWDELRKYNPKWPPHDIRITKKYDSEVFERPEYIRNSQDPEPWARALMFFLNKEIRHENSTYHKKAMASCGLDKYFVTVTYTICRKCNRSCEISELTEHINEFHPGEK